MYGADLTDLEEQLRKLQELAQRAGVGKTYMTGFFDQDNLLQNLNDNYAGGEQAVYDVGLGGLVSEYGMPHESSHGYMSDVSDYLGEDYAGVEYGGEYTGLDMGSMGGLYGGEGSDDAGGSGGDGGDE